MCAAGLNEISFLRSAADGRYGMPTRLCETCPYGEAVVGRALPAAGQLSSGSRIVTIAQSSAIPLHRFTVAATVWPVRHMLLEMAGPDSVIVIVFGDSEFATIDDLAPGPYVTSQMLEMNGSANRGALVKSYDCAGPSA
jgi:hypothetical protein